MLPKSDLKLLTCQLLQKCMRNLLSDARPEVMITVGGKANHHSTLEAFFPPFTQFSASLLCRLVVLLL